MSKTSVSIVGTLQVQDIEKIQKLAKRIVSEDDPASYMVMELD